VRQAGEGCRIKGTLVVKNVPGNFHVSAHSRREFLTQLFPQSKMNVSHVIHHLSFGPQMDVKEQDKTTSFYPLNGHREIIDLEECRSRYTKGFLMMSQLQIHFLPLSTTSRWFLRS
jgi:hypothetical protein